MSVSEKMKPALTVEQRARDMVERMGVAEAQDLSSGDVVELANLLSTIEGFTREDVNVIRLMAKVSFEPETESWKLLDSIADRIEALLPPEK